MTPPALKPCPFCGRRYRGTFVTIRGHAERFECPRCGARGPFPEFKAKGKPQAAYDRATIAAWNRRTP